MKSIDRTLPDLAPWQEQQIASNYLCRLAKKYAREGKKANLKRITSIVEWLFPDSPACVIGTDIFDGYWASGKYKEAVRIYDKADKPFNYADKVGRYYEKKGLLKKAIAEYEYLINVYIKIKILPLPNGPVELYKLGKWYQKRDPIKAKKYLTLYLRAQECKGDPAFRLPYKKPAECLMIAMQAPNKREKSQ